MTAKDVRIAITVDSKTGEARVEALGDAFDKTGKKGKSALGHIRDAAGGLKDRMAPAVGVAAQLGAAFGAYKLAGVAKGFLDTPPRWKPTKPPSAPSCTAPARPRNT